MTVFERIENLRKSKGISQGKLEKELGFSNGSISKWKNSTPTPERLQKLADYFGVSMNYLLNGTEGELSAKDERDIAKDMEALRDKLLNSEEGPASYDGEPIPEEDAELLLGQIELMMRRLKPINKEKYNPNKNKK